VQAAAVTVDEPSRRVGDQLGERRHPVAEGQAAYRTRNVLPPSRCP
jgi:hypothetical protein